MPQELNGFVVNREAGKIRGEDEIAITKDGMAQGWGGRKLAPMTKEWITFADNLTNIIGMMPFSDDEISKLISIEVGKYFAGEATAEDTAKALQNKVGTYLQE